jgi:hypothetical protein
MTGKLSVQVENFKPLRSHSLYGFADLLIPEIRLRIKEASVHQSSRAPVDRIAGQAADRPRRPGAP